MTAPTGTREEPGKEAEEASGGGGLLLKIVLGLGLLALVIFLGRSAGAYVPRFAEWVGGLGPLGPIVFILGYAAAVVGFVPGSVLTLASRGRSSVWPRARFYVFLAADLWFATGAFLIARHGARAAVEKRIEGDARFAAIDRAVGREGRKIVFLLRLSPVFPLQPAELRARASPRSGSSTTWSRPSACCLARCSSSTRAS